MKKILAITFLISSCNSDYEKSITKEYYLISTDTRYNTSLAVKDKTTDILIDVVGPCVFAVGHDEQFIIIKQHPREFPELPNKNITNYFIVPMVKKISKFPDMNKIGPLNYTQFLLKKDSLNISNNIKFDIKLDDLE